jgi:hypothetical protein
MHGSRRLINQFIVLILQRKNNNVTRATREASLAFGYQKVLPSPVACE